MHNKQEYTDEQLYLLFKSGDRDAFGQIFALYRKRLFVEAYHTLRNEEDSLDVIQEAFTYLWQKRHTIEIKTSLLSYLIGIVRYKSIDILERRSRIEKLKSKLCEFEESVSVARTTIEIEEQERLNIFGNQQLTRAINSINNPNRRLAIQKRYIEEKSLPEISSEMGFPEQTIRNWLSQALKQLRMKITKRNYPGRV